MYKKSKLFFIIAETPLHPGSGGDSTGIVDLPIQRERYTNFPKIEASGLKGCIKEAFYETNKEILIDTKRLNPNDKISYNIDGHKKETDYISLVFGPENGDEHASAIAFTDAKILLFPVKSLKGVFAWITCPMVLERFKDALRLTGAVDKEIDYNFSNLVNTVPQHTNISFDSKIVLEEYTFEVKENEATSNIAKFLASKIFPLQNSDDIYKFWRKKLERDLVILSDDDFEQFVATSTEVITRTKIDDITGTVQSGALWTEEYLPQDTILYSLMLASQLRVESPEAKGIFKSASTDEEIVKIVQFFESGIPEIVQIGGNQTIGKGIVRIQILK